MDKTKQLTERQIEVLRGLDACDQCKYSGLLCTLPDGSKKRMYAPMEFGGSDGSHHSATATSLAKMGLVDRLKSSSWSGLELNNFDSRTKGSCSYAITEAGRAALAKAKEPE